MECSARSKCCDVCTSVGPKETFILDPLLEAVSLILSRVASLGCHISPSGLVRELERIGVAKAALAERAVLNSIRNGFLTVDYEIGFYGRYRSRIRHSDDKLMQ